MSLHVRDAGLQSLLVDFGRERSRALGVPVGGAADRASLTLGNALVGNAPNAVALEVAFAGPTLEAIHPVACALFGAPFQATVNGEPVVPQSSFTLNPGDVLRVGGTRRGARAYVCVAGGFQTPEVLGSRSTLEPVRAGDLLACVASRTASRAIHDVCVDSVAVLRVLDGPQRDWFTSDVFFDREYEVSPASNRMGTRFVGESLSRKSGELVSEAVAPGAIQITNDGLPIVLGVDGQTIGGYPKIAHVIRADLDLLAQLRPGIRVRFVRVTAEQAELAARERAQWLRNWQTRLRVAERQPTFD
jgi:biotin-dependent carboxylase-like uncharacterized protein